jgi:hypothetical protein
MPLPSTTAGALIPPPVARARASSTNMRPALTLSSLGARSSFLCKDQDAAVGTPTVPAFSPPSPITVPSAQSLPELSEKAPLAMNTSMSAGMLEKLASRALSLLHFKHSEAYFSTSSSPRSSTDTILPMSASPEHTTFGDVFVEKQVSVQTQPSSRWRSSPSVSRAS